MPAKPRRVCSCAGCPVCQSRCPNLTPGGKCAGCKAESRKAHRGNDHIYSSLRWKGLRRQVIQEQPWCATPGCTELSHDVDHITPIEAGGAQWDRTNLQGLCVPCHSRKTAREVLHRD